MWYEFRCISRRGQSVEKKQPGDVDKVCFRLQSGGGCRRRRIQVEHTRRTWLSQGDSTVRLVPVCMLSLPSERMQQAVACRNTRVAELSLRCVYQYDREYKDFGVCRKMSQYSLFLRRMWLQT